MRNKLYILLFASFLCACNATKFVPEGKYLLNKAKVQCVDDKTVSTGSLRSYLRQTQNTEILGFWKLQLDVYNTAPIIDSTRLFHAGSPEERAKEEKRLKTQHTLANNAHKMGEAPVVYDPELTKVSMQQVKQQMHNMGYFHAEVDTQVVVKNRKVELTYLVTAKEQYHLRRYSVDIPNKVIYRIATSPRCEISEGDPFSTAALDEERERISAAMRNMGYFYFEKDMLEFTADSTLHSHEVDVTIHMAPYLQALDSVTLKRIFTQYKIRNVEYVQTGGKRDFLRKSALKRVCSFYSGCFYSDRRLERTYAKINALPPVKYVDVAFTPVEGDSLLDCTVTISKGKIHSVGAEVEGTYSAGDWGLAAEVNYSNKNIFKGAEVLTVGARASYEWRAYGGRALEAKAEAGVVFPSQVKVTGAYNFQQRPEEYTRTIANACLSYTVPPRLPKDKTKWKDIKGLWTHQFNIVDFNYIYVPWMSERFKRDFINKSTTLLSSYEDHFILDWSYMGTYSTYNKRHPDRSYLQLALRAETAGNFLYMISSAANLSKDELGHYRLGHIPFSQYAKGDVNFTYHGIINPKHHLVGHIGIGVAVPYLNADILPFEKRYFAGGANGIRGWQARTLGPGAFKGNGTGWEYNLRVGDIKLDANIEYRFKVLSFLELAAFLDAGNIWTIKDYPDQPDGVFRWDTFYQQIAWSYGVGIRFDLSLFIFRVDFGVKLHDPSRIWEGKQWRTAPNGLGWKDDMTFHFAIGYPF